MHHKLITLAFVLSLALFALDAPPLPLGTPLPGLLAKPDNLAETVIPLMKESSLPAQWREIDARSYIELPGTFVGNNASRCAWDFQLKSDLRNVQQIHFDLFSTNTEIASNISLYFHSGNGWYATNFSVDEDSTWKHIVIDKGNMKFEDNPGGWGNIDVMRIGFWRTTNGNGTATLGIANIAVSDEKPDVIIIPAESLIGPNDPESKGYMTYAANFGKALANVGIHYRTVSDKELSAEALAIAKIAVLPYNPKVSPENVNILREFIAKGGKLISTYATPNNILDLLDVDFAQQIPPQRGNYSAILATTNALPAQPKIAFQTSWIGKQIAPRPSSHPKVIATWRSADGTNSNVPAVTILDNGAYFGYVWNGSSTSNGDRFILSVIAHFIPQTIEKAAATEFKKLGVISSFKSYDAFRAFLQERKELQTDATLLEAMRNEAYTLLERKEWVAALDKIQEAMELASDLWCRSRTDKPGEIRALWCHRAHGNTGYSWEESAKIIAENGFTDLIVNSTRAATAYYPSKVLETYREYDQQGDLVRKCLDACNKYGVKVHVWRTCFTMSHAASQAYVDRMVAEKRVCVSRNGKVKARWFCPSNPLNQQLEQDAFCELVRNYPDLTGVHFDYIRYSDENHCFCDGCRERFEKYAGLTINNWPDDLNHEDLKEKWHQFRRDNITTVVRDTYKAVKAIRPSIKVSAAVFNNYVSCRTGVGQDWELWCRNGWLDFICPMSYSSNNRSFESLTKVQIPLTHDIPMYQGIGISLWNGTDLAIKAAELIEIVRKYNLPGFVFFEFNPAVIGIMPRLHKGLLK